MAPTTSYTLNPGTSTRDNKLKHTRVITFGGLYLSCKDAGRKSLVSLEPKIFCFIAIDGRAGPVRAPGGMDCKTPAS